ncbi:heat shock protein 70kD, putative [Entamoeba invadens IP1]|uniref:heat shock protein 70kD, putative n=1 Tax=Entamoeba invadens IP1 TaxID=370355 RepID=UPI0002C3D6F6|nr:heat shock protein 70kD, putative [Entamoeba invadens IP1]ELP90403.1 heat shock protein 70kD, putative [Entamoeba invadens IP1]|eukprot:XP_004257174.1 heat shock protein 70kD, putative [Entamoeba invadens IP1]
MATEQINNTISIGIDFGTSKLAISYFENNQNVQTVTFDGGSSIIPAWLKLFNNANQTKISYIVGEQAKKPEDQLDNGETFYNIKRFLGKTFEELQDESDILGFDFGQENGNSVIVIGSQQQKPNTFRPKEIAALFFKKLMNQIKTKIPTIVRPNMFVGVPVKMTPEAIQDLTEAAKLGGFETVDVIAEPMASVLYYLDVNKNSTIKNFIVIDIGAGTLDISCVEKNSNGSYELLYSDGNNDLGGNNFDEVVSKMIIDTVEKNIPYFYTTLSKDLLPDRLNIKRRLNILKRVSEDTKIAFSSNDQVEIDFNNLLTKEDTKNGYLLEICDDKESFILQKVDFIDKADFLFSNIRNTIKNILTQSKLSLKKIEKVILVGGCALIPKVKQVVRASITNVYKSFNGAIVTINKMTTVSEGCAIQANDNLNTNVYNRVIQKTSYTVGLDVSGIFETVIPTNVVLPVYFEKVYQCEKGEQDIFLTFYKTTLVLKANQKHRINCSEYKYITDVKVPPGDTVTVKVNVDLVGNTTVKATSKNGKVDGKMYVDTSSLENDLLSLKRHLENTIYFN